ncbi:GL15763 [Drosophila persimilis]|uniref:GL15763 n=1 Tax=Drosophila persimilis TaxID=7234 RepID=B4GQ63_DROPE|nr:GL15763 [Drosophila persimilis]
MIALSALLTKYTIGIMSNLSNGNPQQQQNQQQQQPPNAAAAAAGQGNAVGGGAGVGIELPAPAPPGLGAAVGVVAVQRQRLLQQAQQNTAAEGSGLERGSCLLRYASQNSLDESSQKHVQRPNGKERGTVGQYSNEQHTTRSFDAMNEMRKQKQLCDVILVADDVEIHAHRMVLASCSPYFYAMFTSFEESRQARITLQSVDARALELLINYVYTSTVEVNEDNVQVLLTAANLLQLTDVRDACCDYLQTQLDASNCLGIREFADLHACVELLNYAETYIEEHFNDVIQFDEFLNLSHEQVINLIGNDRISVPNEERVYECVIAWLRYDVPMREQFTSALMEHVRLPFLSKEYITQRVDKELLLEGNIICKNLIIEALTYHLLPTETKSARTVPRKTVGMPKILLVIGGQAPKAIRAVEWYDLRDEKWYQAAEMPNRRCRSGLSVLGDKVYAVGGFNGALRVRTVDVYDPATDHWASCCNMEARRSTLGVAVLNGCIFAVGGFDGTTGLSSAEMYDPKTDIWRFIASMSTRRSSVGVGVVHGLLYAVGGYDGFSRQCLSSVERYNPDTDTWSAIAEMTSRRSGAGVGVLNNILYAVGGHDGPMVRKSVEAYDCETNTWSSVSDMSYCRRNAGVVAHEGLLYVVGGDDGTSNLASVEVYCPESDSWRILPALMTIGRSYAGVCMIDKPIQAASLAIALLDDENSQAEGTMEGAIGGAIYGNIPPVGAAAAAAPVQPSAAPQPPNHPHYENIYAPIGQPNNNQIVAAANVNAPANVEDAQQPLQLAAQPAPTEANANINPPPQPGPSPPSPQPQPQPQQLAPTPQQRALPMNNYRNDLYDRSIAGAGILGASAAAAAYDVPRAVRSGLGYRRNFRIDMQNGNRYGTGLRCTPLYTNSRSNCQRQRSFDDTESTDGYNLPYAAAGTMRYENIYEQIRDEPIYRPTATNRVPLYTRLDVLGHGIGRIERHLSSSCGNIDHYNLGGHYAVLGHSHYGTVGHIRLNANGAGGTAASGGGSSTCNVPNCQAYVGSASAAAAAAAAAGMEYGNVKVPVKNSASSFFSCLHGENSQSMTNIYKTTAAAMAAHNSPLTPNVSMERAARSASAGAAGAVVDDQSVPESASSSSVSSATRPTGAIPKVKAASKAAKESATAPPIAGLDKSGSTASVKSGPTAAAKSVSTAAVKSAALAKKTTSTTARSSSSGDANGNNTLNRISKSSLQWHLVNKWLPLWIGQGPDCKVIDFNFMFSRDCVSCDTASVASQMSNPYGTPRLGGLPQDMVRYQSSCTGSCAASTASSTMRRDPNAAARPLHSTLSRLRSGADKRNPNGAAASNYRYEDPSYENVHVQWQNGFEFGRSRDYDPTYHQRPMLQRARSESPTFSNQQRRLQRQAAQAQQQAQPSAAKPGDPFKNYKLNTENNSFKPKPPVPVELPDELEGAVGGAAVEVSVAEVEAELPVDPPVNLSDNETETTNSQTNPQCSTTTSSSSSSGSQNNVNEHHD